MSRTYRKQPVWFCPNCHRPTYKGKKVRGYSSSCECKYTNHTITYCEIRLVSDNKLWNKPPKWFKQMNRQRFRAQCKQALYNRVYNNKDFIPPINKKTDQWEWT